MAPESKQEAGNQAQRRPRAATALLLVGAVLAFVAIFSFWANRQLFNTKNWTNTSSELLKNEAIKTQVATFLVDQLYANVNVQAKLEQELPQQLKPLAGTAAGGLKSLAQQIAEKALGTPQFEELWRNANRVAQQQLVKLLDGGGAALSTEGGTVTLNLGQLLSGITSEIGVGGQVASKVPSNASVTIIHSNQLSAAQSVADVIKTLPVILTILLLACFGGAIYLGAPRRRETVRAVGVAFVAAGVVALIVRSFAGNSVVDALAKTEAIRPAANAAWDIGTGLLVTIATSSITFGILVFLAAWFAGPTSLAVAARRASAPYVRESPAVLWLAAGALYLALVALAPIAAFRKPFGILLFALLMVVGAVVMRRQLADEFPDARKGELGQRISERFGSSRKPRG